MGPNSNISGVEPAVFAEDGRTQIGTFIVATHYLLASDVDDPFLTRRDLFACIIQDFNLCLRQDVNHRGYLVLNIAEADDRSSFRKAVPLKKGHPDSPKEGVDTVR